MSATTQPSRTANPLKTLEHASQLIENLPLANKRSVAQRAELKKLAQAVFAKANDFIEHINERHEDRTHWRTKALCQVVNPEMFFPERGDSATKATFQHSATTVTMDATIVSRVVCNACPVKKQCLKYAMSRNERHGVWGGLTTPERDQLYYQVHNVARSQNITRSNNRALNTSTRSTSARISNTVAENSEPRTQ